MAGNIVNQNKSLSDAGKSPKDTSYRDKAAQSYSAKVVTSRPNGASTNSQGGAQIVSRSSGKKVRGSFEGLNHSSQAVLQFNGVGYDSKSNQGARYNKNFASHDVGGFSQGSFAKNKNYSIMDNYSSVTSENSSSDRLTNIVKNNMMFR